MEFSEAMAKIDAAWSGLEERLHETFREDTSSSSPHEQEPAPKPLIPLAYCIGSFSIQGSYPKVDRWELVGSDSRFICLRNPSFTLHIGDAFPEDWQELCLLLDEMGKLAAIASGHNPYSCHSNYVGFMRTESMTERSIAYGKTRDKATRWYGEYNVRSKVAELWPDRGEVFASAFSAYQAGAATYHQPDVETAAKVPTYLSEHEPGYLH